MEWYYIVGAAITFIGTIIGFIYKYIKDLSEVRLSNIEKSIKELQGHQIVSSKLVVKHGEQLKWMRRVCRLRHEGEAYLDEDENGSEIPEDMEG